MYSHYEVGDTIVFKSFCFHNKAGGTGVSDMPFNEIFEGVAKGKIVRYFWDYETGYHYVCISASENLRDYMFRNSLDMFVYVSEFDIEEKND